MKVHNNIFYNNGKVAVKNVSGNSVVSHNLFFGNTQDYQGSNIQNSNLTSNPQFINTNSPPDFSSYQLPAGSPAINAGLNVNSFYQEFGQSPPSISGNAPDMGWQESGSTVLPTNPPPTSPAPSGTLKAGDANNDNKVDGLDYVIWLNNYNKNVSVPAVGDFNNSGKVDGLDYVIWLTNYGK